MAKTSGSNGATAFAAAPGALQGVRVIDLTSVMMGPAATQTLCDMGADVIKVEAPEGDIIRRIGPARHAGMGAIFLQNNRGKRSLVLDLKRPGARECILALARTADMLVYNVRPQAMARLNLAYEDLRAANPRIVYAGLFGYDQNGPYADRPAYDDLIQSLVALPTLAVMAGADRPRFVPIALADRYVAAVGVGAMVAALFHAHKTGEGQRLDITMFEAMAQLVLSDHAGGRSFEPPLGPPGYKRTLSRERMPYPTRDGHISVLAYTDAHWRTLFRLIGRPDLPDSDPRFADMTQRTLYIDELYLLLAGAMLGRGTSEWLEALRAADIPCAPLNTLDSLMDDPHLAAIGFFQLVEHPSEGPLRMLGMPTAWSRTPVASRGHAPRLGQHSVEVLREAGCSAQDIARMLAVGTTLDGNAQGDSGNLIRTRRQS